MKLTTSLISPSKILDQLEIRISKINSSNLNKVYQKPATKNTLRSLSTVSIVEDQLDFGKLVKLECKRNKFSKFSKQRLFPFQRLKITLCSISYRAQSKLIRCTSTDEEAQDFKIQINTVVNDIVHGLYISLPLESDVNQPQLQKKLILANSKSLAKERLRDIALSILDTKTKEEYRTMTENDNDNRRAKTSIEDIVAAMLARGNLDGSLAGCTDDELIICGRKLERHRRKKDQVVHIPEDQKVIADYVIDELEDTIASMHWSDMKGYENVNVCFRLAAA